ncbi:DUF1641 domain-containing protein [Acidicapsa ligni]|uniref:DUF1641 domain-containing protein n=1 Tax=Acidicapsa ligni TaxID=542300 RepID=UPI0021E0BA30|nr:hypothetical protein [Acidicapsa ligni]
MAQPIPLKLPPRDPKQELQKRLEEASTEYAAALLDGYELLQKLHEHGIFTIARGVLSASDKLVESVSSGANSAESIRTMRNALILAKMLGSIDPAILQSVATAVGESFGDAKSIPSQPPGLVSVVAGFTGPEQRRGLGLVSNFLKKLGMQLKSSGSASANH